MEGQDILVVGALGFAAYYLYQQFAKSSTTTTTPSTPGGQGNPLANTAINSAGVPSGSVGSKPPVSVPTSVQLVNVTTGQPNFNVGDSWKVSISGPPNSPVSVQATQNGVPSSANFGSTGANGNFTMNGTMAAGDVGSWVENWIVGNNAPAQISFVVSSPTPANTPLYMTQTQAGIHNDTNPANVNLFQVGDSWTLTITGPPNTPVTGSATHNGATSTGSFGSTDSSGTKVIKGTMDSSTVGSWSEVWQVGNTTPASINFSVVSLGF